MLQPRRVEVQQLRVADDQLVQLVTGRGEEEARAPPLGGGRLLLAALGTSSRRRRRPQVTLEELRDRTEVSGDAVVAATDLRVMEEEGAFPTGEFCTCWGLH